MELDDFVSANAPDEGDERFELEHSKLLDIDVDGTVMAKAGSMVAFDGDLTFTGKSSAEGGLTGFLKEKATSEGTPVMAVEGQGHLYVADQAKEVQVLGLGEGEAISVNGEDVLAFESGLSYEITEIDSLAGAFAGGFTNVALEGPGHVALTTHGDPVVMEPPVTTDPGATVAWSATAPDVEVNTNVSDMIGQESGERFQMQFTDRGGFVIVQPYEEHA